MILDLRGTVGNLLEVKIQDDRNDDLNESRDQSHIGVHIEESIMLAEIREERDLEEGVMLLRINDACQVQENDVQDDDQNEVGSHNGDGFQIASDPLLRCEHGLLAVSHWVPLELANEFFPHIILLVDGSVIIPLNVETSASALPENDKEGGPDHNEDGVYAVQGGILKVPVHRVDDRDYDCQDAGSCEPFDEIVHPGVIHGD